MGNELLKVKITSESGTIPDYATDGASGVDLRAYTEESIVLKPMERKLIPTGLKVEIPFGFEGQVRARSGLAIKNGITLINAIGTIDSDYRGELKVPLINLGDSEFLINNGDRIAQFIITKYEKVNFELVEELADTERGAGGFGHTGIKG